MEVESMYQLRGRCINSVVAVKQLNPSSISIGKSMDEAIARIVESAKDCKLDADFTRLVHIMYLTIGHGRGMLAIEFMKAGIVLLVHKDFARCNNYSDPFIHLPMANGLVRNVENAINQEGDRVLKLFYSFNPSNNNLFKRYVPTFDIALYYLESPYSSQIICGEYEKLGMKCILCILKTIAFDDMSP